MTKPEGRDGSSAGSEPTFADVLNNLSLDSSRPRRRSRTDPADTAGEPDPGAGPRGRVDEVPDRETAGLDDVGGDEAASDEEPGVPAERDEPESAELAAAVRPYTWTGGRTRPVTDLEVETLISTSEYGRDVAALTSVEHRSVAELCTDPRSVAEIAALLSLPLGVARVVVADMADIGLVEVHRTAGVSGQAPDMDLMERVLSGLRRL